ncbi:hypothetical protein FHS78_001245 [Parvibaculum indicum]|uniref:DUF4238 domain-containing protein n=1 Tax=Parvibaculum indicum TaxID=562969 RepID=UPI001421C91D|nr:DUF4238 domain-containing protein [Parvibaculum indicum]NIJ40964.1 hypothetical protein [Parvibaculum indicum]
MAKPPRRHHFVPRLILKGFVNSEENLYFFNKNNVEGGVGEASPLNLFVKNHLYSEIEEDGSRNAQLETDLSTFEGRVDRIVQKIVENVRRGSKPCLTPQEKEEWDAFTALQLKRLPQILDKHITQEAFDETLDEFIADFEANEGPLSEAVRRDIDSPEKRARLRQNVKVSTIRQPMPKVVSALQRKGLGVAVIVRANKSYVIGSNPIVKLNYAGRSSLLDPSTEVWFPISADVAVSPAFEAGKEVVVEINSDSVRYINSAVYRQSDLVAGRSKELIESLVRMDVRQSKRAAM